MSLLITGSSNSNEWQERSFAAVIAGACPHPSSTAAHCSRKRCHKHSEKVRDEATTLVTSMLATQDSGRWRQGGNNTLQHGVHTHTDVQLQPYLVQPSAAAASSMSRTRAGPGASRGLPFWSPYSGRTEPCSRPAASLRRSALQPSSTCPGARFSRCRCGCSER